MKWRPREPITDKKVLATKRLSPSSINCFRSCPRKWFFEYVKAYVTKTSLPLVRGNVVHETIEDLFKYKIINSSGEMFRKEMLQRGLTLFNKKWNDPEDGVNKDKLDISDEVYDYTKEESETMITNFINKFCDKVQSGIKTKKFASERQGYYYLRPIFKELWIDDEKKIKFTDKYKKKITKETEMFESSLHVGGFIDSVQKDFDGNLTLIDYKTSTKYQCMVKEDYLIQLGIYAYLWEKQTGNLPRFVGINYLKYDETILIMVTPSLVHEAKYHIKNMRNNLIDFGLDEEKYFCKPTKLCDWCSFKDKCANIENIKRENVDN